VIRSLFIVPLAASSTFSDYMLGPFHLFRIELWVLLALFVWQWFALQGNYSAKSEWQPSLIDGCTLAAKLIAISVLTFFPTWWMMQPGKYGKFRGSFVGGLVSARATDMFKDQQFTANPENLARVQNRAAIPHAIVIATGLTLILFLVASSIKYLRGVLKEDYLHLPPKPKPTKDNNSSFPFNPRGGGPN
jgi:hypothetical protein